MQELKNSGSSTFGPMLAGYSRIALCLSVTHTDHRVDNNRMNRHPQMTSSVHGWSFPLAVTLGLPCEACEDRGPHRVVVYRSIFASLNGVYPLPFRPLPLPVFTHTDPGLHVPPFLFLPPKSGHPIFAPKWGLSPTEISRS